MKVLSLTHKLVLTRRLLKSLRLIANLGSRQPNSLLLVQPLPSVETHQRDLSAAGTPRSLLSAASLPVWDLRREGAVKISATTSSK